MPTKKDRLLITLDPDHKERLDQLADQLHMSRAEVLRRLLMNKKIPSPADFAASEAILDLLKVNADLARLGNLLKLALDEPLSADLLAKFDRLTDDIRDAQSAVKTAARDVSDSIGPRARSA